MKGISKIVRRLMLAFLALIASSMMFFSSPAVAATSSLLYLTDADFKTEVLDSDKPVIVYFSASWAGPCRLLAPIVDGIAKDYQNKVKVYELDIDDSPKTTQRFGVRSVPTLIVFKNGQKFDQITGLASRDKILKEFGL